MSNPAAAIPPCPSRPDDAHKGTFGTVVVVGGSPTMIGAPALAATAALRGGAGLVKIAADPDILPFCLTIEPSATGLVLPRRDDGPAMDQFMRQLDERTVLAIGPGMGVGADPQSLLKLLLRLGRPVVLDADGLNNLSLLPGFEHVARCPLVMTPHPGEFRRLAAPLNIPHDPTDASQRPAAAEALAKACRCVAVLKGRHTVVSDGRRHYVNDTGNPALATAGSGDVLTGLVASLTAQGMTPFDAAVLGVYLHGLAADLWSSDHGPTGLTARDLASLLPRAMRRHGDHRSAG